MKVAALCAAIVVGSGGPAAAEIVGAAGTTLEDAVLVGAGGERWQRDPATARWRRAGEGGVATKLVRARWAAGEIWAMGEQTPPYRLVGGAWSAVPPPLRAAAVFSSSGLPAIAVKRRVFYYGRAVPNGPPGWHPLGAPGTLAALWVGGPRDAVGASEDGRLLRWTGSAWRALRAAFPRGERVAAIHAFAARRAIVCGENGTMLVVAGMNARTVPLRLRVRAAASGLLLGQTAQGGVAVVDGARFATVATLAATEGDPAVALLALSDRSVLVVTRHGRVYRRGPDGALLAEAIDGTAVAQPSHRPNPPALSPARSASR